MRVLTNQEYVLVAGGGSLADRCRNAAMGGFTTGAAVGTAAGSAFGTIGRALGGLFGGLIGGSIAINDCGKNDGGFNNGGFDGACGPSDGGSCGE